MTLFLLILINATFCARERINRTVPNLSVKKSSTEFLVEVATQLFKMLLILVLTAILQTVRLDALVRCFNGFSARHNSAVHKKDQSSK